MGAVEAETAIVIGSAVEISLRNINAMSSDNRHDRGALVALGLVLAAIVLVAFTTASRESPREVLTAPISQDGRDFVIFGDGLAQWLMAWFTIVATGVSIYAVRLVRDTFRETRRTANAAVDNNKTAREALDAQQRPWLKVEGMSIEEITYIGTRLSVRGIVSVTNLGTSPAQSVECHARLKVRERRVPWEGNALLSELCYDATHSRSIGINYVVYPGSTERIPFSARIDDPFTAQVDGENSIMFPICVTYHSVFNPERRHIGYLASLDFSGGFPGPTGDVKAQQIVVRDERRLVSMS